MRLNGNLVLNSDATGEIQQAYIERLASAPAFNAAEKGRLYFNTTTSLYYFNDGTAWVAIATGGNAAALQTEVDYIESSIGAAVNSNGTYNGSTAFSGDPIISGATSITNALLLIAQAAYGHELLSELGDVNLGVLSGGQYLKYDAGLGKWVNETLVLADVTDVTSTAAEVNKLHGFTGSTANLNVLSGTTASAADLNSITGYAAQSVTPTEFGYLAGATPVTSSVQDQLNNKQPLNAGLTGVATLANGSGTGIVIQTGVNSFTDRSLVAPASGFSITNPDGVAGNPTFTLTHNLAALEGLAGTGFVVHTGNGTFIDGVSLVTASASRIVVTNGDGVAASPTIDLATVSDAGTGSFLKFTRDAYGRVSGTTPVVLADITALADATYVNVTGDSMTGNLTMTSGATVTGIPTPVNSSDVANKAYVDASAQGLYVHGSVEAATTGALSGVTYNNGTAGVGATLTATTFGALNLDGYTSFVAGVTRVLVKDQASAAQNGIYVVTNAGSAGSAFVLTRATDADNHTPDQVIPGSFVFVSEGTTQSNTGWVQTGVGTGTNDAIVLGTDNVAFTQFSGAGTYTAGVGLNLSGTTFSVLLGAGIANLPSGEVGVDLFNTTTGALILTDNGTSRNPDSASQLHLLLKSAGGLTQDAAGLYIPTAGVTNAMLATSGVITLDVDSAGTGSIALGGTLSILGDSAKGLSSSISGSTINLTIADAAYAQKGVAQFTAGTFSVSAGTVNIASAGVTNGMLANPSYGISGTTGGVQQIALGTTLSVVGGTSPITTVSSAGTLTINVAAASTGTLGLASFNGSQFAVTAGAVSLQTTLGQGGITNVAGGVDTASDADLLTFSSTAGKWVNATRAVVFGTESVGSLSDVALSGVNGGDTLVYSAAASKFENRPTYFLYSSTGTSTTHTVNHGLGQKYCNVTVVDSTDEVVIPQSITFVSGSQLVVTFTSSIACKVVVMGVNAA